MRIKVQMGERYWAKMLNQCPSQAEFSTKLKQLNPTTATASTSKSISEAIFSFANPTHMHQRELLIYQRTFQQRTWCITRGKPTLLFCFGIPPPPAAQFGPAASKLLLQTSFQLQSLGQTSTDTNTPYAGADDRGVALPPTLQLCLWKSEKGFFFFWSIQCSANGRSFSNPWRWIEVPREWALVWTSG